MRVFGASIRIALLVAILGVFPHAALAQQQCKHKASIDYYGTWGPYYDGCASEMKTTFEFELGWDGSPQAWCEVDNSPFQQIYDPQSSPIVEYTHCTNTQNHRLLIDIQPTIDQYGFIPPMKLTAEYYEDTPQ